MTERIPSGERKDERGREGVMIIASRSSHHTHLALGNAAKAALTIRTLAH